MTAPKIIKACLIGISFLLATLLGFQISSLLDSPERAEVSFNWDSNPTLENLINHPLLNTVIVGQVLEENPGMGEPVPGMSGNSFPFTEWTVSVKDYLLSPLSYKQVKVRVLGGVKSDVENQAPQRLESEGMPFFQKGEQVVLFLGKDESFFSLKEDEFTVMYGEGGIYHILADETAVNRRGNIPLTNLIVTIRVTAKNFNRPTPIPAQILSDGSSPPTATPAHLLPQKGNY